MKLLCHPPEVLNEDELEQIWQAAQSVWARVPVRIQGTDEFYDYLSSFGCQIDGELVSFPEGKAYESDSDVRLWHPMKPGE